MEEMFPLPIFAIVMAITWPMVERVIIKTNQSTRNTLTPQNQLNGWLSMATKVNRVVSFSLYKKKRGVLFIHVFFTYYIYNYIVGGNILLFRH